MSSYYLIDLFDTTPTVVSPPNNTGAPIIAVVAAPPSGQVLSTGSFVVRLPNSASPINPITGQPTVPQNLGDLIAFKYQGLLSFFAGTTHITYDDLLDATGVSSISTGASGKKGTITLNPGGILTSNTITLPATPANAVFTWEVFQNVDADTTTGRFSRTYQELPTTSTNTTAQVSFNGGGTYTSVSDLLAFNIPVAAQGTSFIVKITNTSSSKLNVGSWALIY